MKIKKLFAFILILLGLVNANAQLVENETVSESKHDLYTTENFMAFQVGWAKVSGTNTRSTKGVGLNGVIIQYDVFQNITGYKIPLFLMAGGDLGIAFGKASYDSEYSNLGMTSGVHIGVAYKLKILEDFFFTPFVCANIKITPLAEASDGDGNSINYLGKEQDGYTYPYCEGHKAHIIQPGAIVGGLLEYKNFCVSYKYSPDFVPFFKNGDDKISLNTHILSVGYRYSF